MSTLPKLLKEVRACTICKKDLPLGPRPVVRMKPSATLLIIGQAPGTRVHESGIPWDDKSGDRLRQWLAVDKDTFYDEGRIAIMPMGFCYPGVAKNGGDKIRLVPNVPPHGTTSSAPSCPTSRSPWSLVSTRRRATSVKPKRKP